MMSQGGMHSGCIFFVGIVLIVAGCNSNTVLDEKFLVALQVKPVSRLSNQEAVVEDVPRERSVSDAAGPAPKTPSIVHIKPIETLQIDGVHDLENDAIVILQDPTIAMADFPLDRRKQVDWVATLDAGLIQPRADLKGEGGMLVMDMDIVMKNTQFMPYVRFPHIAHTKWLDCSNCHPKIFIPQEHANPISMNKVLRGQYCGVCHDKVAFALFICERCHSVPHAGSGKKWW